MILISFYHLEKGPLWTYFWNSLYSHQPGEITNLKENDISPYPSSSLLQLNTDVLPEESVSVAYDCNKRPLSSSCNISDGTFTFKFTAHKHTYRILCRPKLVDLMNAIHAKVKDGNEICAVSYVDDEQDQVFISEDTDLEDAVDQAIKSGQTCVKLVVQNHVAVHPVQTEKLPTYSPLLLPTISLLGVAVTAVFICSKTSKQ